MSNGVGDSPYLVHDRGLLLEGTKRNQLLTLPEVEQYGLDSFGDRDYLRLYGIPPREWYRLGVRLLGRTAVECTRDALAQAIGLDVAEIAAHMPSTNRTVVIDPFAGSCNTLFWILRHVPNAEGLAFESDAQVFELTRRNLAALGQTLEFCSGDFLSLLKARSIPTDRNVVVFVAPPWGKALDAVQGLDLSRTNPPITEVIERVARQFGNHYLLFAIQVYEKVRACSLAQIQAQLDWTDLRIYKLNEKGGNHGIVLGTKGWRL